MWKNKTEPDKSQMTMWCMRIACWIPKAKKNSEHTILIAFSRQQWLHERASVSWYRYIASLGVPGKKQRNAKKKKIYIYIYNIKKVIQ